MRFVRSLLIAALLCLCVPAFADAPAFSIDPSWTRPFPPFRIAGNLYYVGSEELAAFLIATPQGNILINSNLITSPAQIKHSVEALGFHFSDIKILLISHAHPDHSAGSAAILQQTHAKYFVMDADVRAIESGGRTDFRFAGDKSMWYPPAHVDRILHDGEKITLGGTTLVAHLTAGHTPGTVTYTFDETEAGSGPGKPLHVVIVGSPSILESYKLIGNPTYPHIADDFRHQFAVLKSLPCDIFLGAHASYFDLTEKYARLKRGDKNAFIDPAGYTRFVADREQAFETAYRKQYAARKTPMKTQPGAHPGL
ncbi:subclass B3 metallo-beta-lactamase [Terracidiphilus sp.]|jgi:metallo-beta-lactamase class B|uniref:subclass B3 metallo-beta-lactamase n=1 Tax=Terracidiphilus sp. TaxID=1964191 RepID=UPI003C73B7D4